MTLQEWFDKIQERGELREDDRLLLAVGLFLSLHNEFKQHPDFGTARWQPI